VAAYHFCHQQLRECDGRIEEQLKTLPAAAAPAPLPERTKARRRNRNRPGFDPRPLLHRVSGVDLTRIEGIDETTALTVLGEIGLDMSRWATVKHFTSWLGLCPHHRISGGRVLSRRTRPTANRAAAALRLAAASLHRSQSALGAFFRRLKSRKGTPKAITATAHKLARYVYTMLKQGEAYVAQSLESYEAQHRERQLRGLSRRARELGYELVTVEETNESR
jgi:transposase